MDSDAKSYVLGKYPDAIAVSISPQSWRIMRQGGIFLSTSEAAEDAAWMRAAIWVETESSAPDRKD